MEERCPAAQTHPVSFFSFSPLKNKQHWVLLAKPLSVSSSHSSGPSAPADAQPPPRPHGQPLRGQAWGPPSPAAPHPTICLPPGQTDILSDASDPDHADCAPPKARLVCPRQSCDFQGWDSYWKRQRCCLGDTNKHPADTSQQELQTGLTGVRFGPQVRCVRASPRLWMPAPEREGQRGAERSLYHVPTRHLLFFPSDSGLAHRKEGLPGPARAGAPRGLTYPGPKSVRAPGPEEGPVSALTWRETAPTCHCIQSP